MKARTRIQIAVDKYQGYLPELTEQQIDFAKGKFFIKQCYRTKHKAFCLECGNDIDVSLISRKKVVCPHCKEKLHVFETRKKKFSSGSWTLAVASLVKIGEFDFQLVRNFEFIKYGTQGSKAKFYIHEFCQNWYEKKGKRVIYSQLINGYQGTYYGNLEVRQEGYFKTYDPIPDNYCPTSEFRSEYVRRGINPSIEGIKLTTLIRCVDNPRCETLIKAGYYNIVGRWDSYEISVFWPTLKICMRNNYKIKDAQNYLDLLKALSYLNKDLRNSHYVCPKNLDKAHDFYIKEKSKIEHGKTIAANLERARKANPKYVESKQKFFGLKFSNNYITVRPLKSVEEFLKEGTELEHCIYRSDYYKKDDKLILSARIKDKPIETIEISLKNFEILQCRGFKNKPSQHHSEIKKLVTNNIHQIKRLCEAV